MTEDKITDTVENQMVDDDELQGLDWPRLAKAAASSIDPETAEVACFYEEADDPYGVIRKNWAMSPRGDVRMYYARAPENNVPEPFSRYGEFARQHDKFQRPWVWFGDLPEAVQKRLFEKHTRWGTRR